MTDENAFGLLIAYYSVEDDEYGLENTEAFVTRFLEFRSVALDWLGELGLPEGAHALHLGHALYVEWPEPTESAKEPEGEAAASAPSSGNRGNTEAKPFEVLNAARQLRTRLSEHDFLNVVVLSHGSRWVSQLDTVDHDRTRVGTTECLLFSNPSEPLRRSLYAETATRSGESQDGWGPGLYLDTEAVEALGKQPKNAPTLLEVAGAKFYRAGR